jgi:hypothetical protein
MSGKDFKDEDLQTLIAIFSERYSVQVLVAVLRHHSSQSLERIINELSDGITPEKWLNIDGQLPTGEGFAPFHIDFATLTDSLTFFFSFLFFSFLFFSFRFTYWRFI